MDFIIPIVVTIIIFIIAASKKGTNVHVSDAVRLVPIVTTLSANDAFEVILKFAKYNGYTVDTAEKENGRIVLNQSGSIMSYGSFFPIHIASRSDGKTIVEVGIRGKMSQKDPLLSKNHERCVDGIKSHLVAAE
jgi:hypothetical protein